LISERLLIFDRLFFALKGQYIPAQGNALGDGTNVFFSPEGALQNSSRYIRPEALFKKRMYYFVFYLLRATKSSNE